MYPIQLQIQLSQGQRRKLADLLKFEPKPKGINHARWRVMQLGAASELSEGECAILADRLGYDFLEELRDAE